jgi:hypothetical protein
MRRHHQMGQRELLQRWHRCFLARRCQLPHLVCDPVGTERAQDIDLTAPRRFGAMVGEVDDLALPIALDGGVWRIDKTGQALR